MHHVAFLHDVLFAFEAEQALLARSRIGASAGEVCVADDLGADEAALDVGVDRAGGLRGARAARDRPGAHLYFARR